VIFSSPSDKADITRRDFSATAKSTQAPFPVPPGNAPIFSSSICYTSADTCRNETTQCSGRGQCLSVKKGVRECFVCQCALTKDAKNRTEYWSGSSCQNKDVSTCVLLFPFLFINSQELQSIYVALRDLYCYCPCHRVFYLAAL
jgi:Domain of unknown function (DUF3844)